MFRQFDAHEHCDGLSGGDCRGIAALRAGAVDLGVGAGGRGLRFLLRRPPHFNFAVSDTEYLFTFGVMLATGLIISTLTLRVTAPRRSSPTAATRTAALYEMSRELAATLKNRRRFWTP